MTDFEWTKAQFHLPDGLVYLDGNSLGPLAKGVEKRVARAVREEWGELLITAWNRVDWIGQPTRLGDRIGRLIGAEPSHTVVGDTLSIKVYQALAAALSMRPGRRVVLSDSGNFPSDLYMASGLLKLLGDGRELVTVEPEAVEAALDQNVAVLMLTEVDYRTGRLHDMARLTRKAHACGALALWDLAHSAGAIPVDLAACEADFAVGCTYKYLNGGPGAPAFIYVRPGLAEDAVPTLSGWLGHAAPFDFAPEYRPGRRIERMRIGTPPVIQMAALDCALDIWDQVDMADVRRRQIELSEQFIDTVLRSCPQLKLVGPADPARRGSQVSFRFEHGYAAMQACIERGLVGDFRAPDIMRFGITPLYIDEADIARAAGIIESVMAGNAWSDERFRQRAAVT